MLDVNIFLDAARLLGEPFSWARLREQQAEVGCHPSIKTIALLSSGRMPDGVPVEVWTSEHIDRLVSFKAYQPVDAKDERDRGLGWSLENAQGLIDHLVEPLVAMSNGNTVGDTGGSYGSPPLSHEDGCVYATVNQAGHEGIHYERFCITRDKQFLTSRLPGLIDVHEPQQWVAKHTAISRAAAFKTMLSKNAQ